MIRTKHKFKDIIRAAKDQSIVKGLTHRFYTYPAGFSPKFVSSAIENLTKKGDVVLDPFMGGGTSIVAKMLSANKDVNIASGPLLEILRLQRNLILNKFDKKKYSFNFTSKLPFQDYYYSDESTKILDTVMTF